MQKMRIGQSAVIYVTFQWHSLTEKMSRECFAAKLTDWQLFIAFINK